MSVPNPMGLWRDAPGGITRPARLVPYKTTAGYWVFVPEGDGPSGATQGAFTDVGEYDTLVTSTTTGLRITRGPGGSLTIR